MRKSLWIIISPIIALLGFYGLCQIYNQLYSKALNFSIRPQAADIKQCQQIKRRQDFKTLRILVISGGGAAGLIPLSYLKYLEKKTNHPTHELFDLFVGTSTGSIIISFLNAPNHQGHIMSAEKLSDDYLLFSKQILHASFWRKIFTLNGLIGPKYNIQELYKVYQEHSASNTKFFEIKNYIAIIDYLIESLELTTISNWDCSQELVYANLAQILAAATAAPLKFAPAIYHLSNGKRATYIDGAVIANYPSLQAIQVVKKQFPNVEKIIIVSLGTGRDALFEYHLDKKQLQHWGLLQWIEPLTRIFYFSQYFQERLGMEDVVSFVPKGKLKFYFFLIEILLRRIHRLAKVSLAHSFLRKYFAAS
jgi:predicted acylesterase/phospholipase RssA